ncbi:MAG: alpha/beta hydrolase [Alteromonadaceae bacterium]|nr:alpha/beta hydrolase [Alteromonadaceae bacterium]
MQKCYMNLPEGQIHYRIAGSGKPLLLLHQSPMNGVEWDDVMPFLSQNFMVIAPDMIGHGQSYEPETMSMEAITEATVCLMDALKLDKVYLAGNHSGGAVACSIATKHPERVVKLAMSCEMLITKAQIEQFLNAIKDKPLSRDIPMDTEGQFIAEAWLRYAALAPTSPLEVRYKPFIHGQMARLRKFDIHEIIMHWMASEQWLEKVTCPTLVFGAENDLFFSEELMRSGPIRNDNCQTAVVKQGGALCTFEQPEQVGRLLNSFFNA